MSNFKFKQQLLPQRTKRVEDKIFKLKDLNFKFYTKKMR